MEPLLNNSSFLAAYDRLTRVSLNPRRHTAENARAHSDAVAHMAARLAAANGCSEAESALLTNLGHAHDLGKITGTARPERSLEVLAACGVTDPQFLALVKWHDTNLPWHRSTLRGESPSDRAWRRLASEVDVRLLCLFMVADRVDAPGGWRRNAPLTWFLAEARRRGLVADLTLDLDDHPSEVCAGAALVRPSDGRPSLLLIRTRSSGWELPKGGIEWDELPCEAALRELREESGIHGELSVVAKLGHLDYHACAGRERRRLKRVHYYLARPAGALLSGERPASTREVRWFGADELDSVPLVSDDLRGLLHAALEQGTAHASTGRTYAPGGVAVLDASGDSLSCRPSPR